jgi:transposase-like protein
MVEIFQGRARRRWSEEDKRRLVEETLGNPPVTTAYC